jgi:hypothetical protein
MIAVVFQFGDFSCAVFAGFFVRASSAGSFLSFLSLFLSELEFSDQEV